MGLIRGFLLLLVMKVVYEVVFILFGMVLAFFHGSNEFLFVVRFNLIILISLSLEVVPLDLSLPLFLLLFLPQFLKFFQLCLSFFFQSPLFFKLSGFPELFLSFLFLKFSCFS
jgi:hypothetical protein